MKFSFPIKDGVLVGVIRRSSGNKRHDKRRLSREAPAGKDVRPTIPTDNARVNEDPVASILCYAQVNLFPENVERRLRRESVLHAFALNEF